MRLADIFPLQCTNGASPASAAACPRLSCVISGRRITTLRAVRSPMPGTLSTRSNRRPGRYADGVRRPARGSPWRGASTVWRCRPR
jgi:hypothetical protein